MSALAKRLNTADFDVRLARAVRNIDFCAFTWRGRLILMDTTSPGGTRRTWSRILMFDGTIAMLVGTIEPMEGSLVILPGSGLVALGTFLGQTGQQLIAYRLWVFVLITIGVGPLLGLTLVGGIGGKSGHSIWWGLLILPYLIGWGMGILGPGSPRWLLAMGIVVGVWYLAILSMVFRGAGEGRSDAGVGPVLISGALGVLTIGGCIIRLRNSISGEG